MTPPVSPAPPNWQELLAAQLVPSKTVEGLVEALPDLWTAHATFEDDISFPNLERELDEVPISLSKAQDKSQDEVKERLKEAQTLAENQVDLTLALFDREYAQAMERLDQWNLPNTDRGSVIYDWASAADSVLAAGLARPSLGVREKHQWRYSRISAFWDKQFEHQPPEMLAEVPRHCALRDWGIAMHTLIRRARDRSQLTPSLQGWLDAFHHVGQALDDTWACSSPRQVMLTESNHQLATDSRPVEMRRDDHYATATGPTTAWAQWLAQAPRPRPHPATRDWLGALHALTRPPQSQWSMEQKVDALLLGLDPATVLEWANRDPAEQRPGGATWEDLEVLAQDRRLPEVPGALLAHVRAQSVPAGPDRAPRRRYRT